KSRCHPYYSKVSTMRLVIVSPTC
ncbi:putative sodium-type flagellar protein motY, partial [Vibrio parahaemolyticus V-223/04]